MPERHLPVCLPKTLCLVVLLLFSIVVFSISKAAPFRRTPPPIQPLTVTALRAKVPPVALMPPFLQVSTVVVSRRKVPPLALMQVEPLDENSMSRMYAPPPCMMNPGDAPLATRAVCCPMMDRSPPPGPRRSSSPRLELFRAPRLAIESWTAASVRSP